MPTKIKHFPLYMVYNLSFPSYLVSYCLSAATHFIYDKKRE